MASSKKGKKRAPKPLTREELGGMSHKELASVKTKRRLMSSLPSAESKPKPEKAKTTSDEKLSPRDRMRRGHQVRDDARAAAAKGGDDGE